MNLSFKKYSINEIFIALMIIVFFFALFFGILFFKKKNQELECYSSLEEKIEWENKTINEIETEIEIIFKDDCYYKGIEELIKDKKIPTSKAAVVAYKGKWGIIMRGYIKERERREKLKKVKL